MIRPVIIDCHTHIFPPEVRERREEYVRRDVTFAEMYGSAEAAIATAEELLEGMERAGVDVSVAAGFAWTDHELCVRHNDYLLAASARSGGRILPFCTVNLRAGEAAAREAARCAAAGAGGLGELRPQSQGWSLTDSQEGESLAALAREYGLILLFHVTEPEGHDYPGKQGLPVAQFYRFVCENDAITVIGAHCGGGLPFHRRTPEVRRLFRGVYVDTAAAPYLYGPDVYGRLASLVGADRILMGSDFPLIDQARQVDAVRKGGLDEAQQHLVLGGNAQRLLGLDEAKAS